MQFMRREWQATEGFLSKRGHEQISVESDYRRVLMTSNRRPRDGNGLNYDAGIKSKDEKNWLF